MWAPNNWASITAEGFQTGLGTNSLSFFDSQDFRGYRASQSPGEVHTIQDVYTVFYNNRRALESDISNAELTVTVIEQGPPDPVGNKWVLDVNIVPAFVATDGTPYYKKTIVVSDTIPTQTDTLPYSSTS